MVALRGYSGARLSTGYRHDCPAPRGGGGGRRPGGVGVTGIPFGSRVRGGGDPLPVSPTVHLQGMPGVIPRPGSMLPYSCPIQQN